MKIYVLSSLLLACSVSGSSLGKDVQSGAHAIQNGVSSKTQKIESPVDNALSWFKNFANKLTMRDDSDKPVPLNIIEPSGESLQDTKKDLPNRVFFYLHRRVTQNNPEMLYVNDPVTLRKSHFDPEKPIVFVTHGWTASRFGPSCVMVRNAFLEHCDCNVIAVDWSKISKESYETAARRIKLIGGYVADMIDFLVGKGANASRMTLVGHSLGAHVVGLAGYYAKSKVNYVVGLDAANPLFNFAAPSERLSTESANYVLAIHTNAGLNGFFTSIAHSDYYANDGTRQPGCQVDVSCSHGRAYQYFAESINSKVGFWGLQCNRYLEFETGLCNSHALVRMPAAEPNVNVRGVFYFKTRSSSPFALGRNN